MTPGQHHEDRFLVDTARRGDPAAFDRLVQRHQDAVYNLAFRISGNRDDALELSQDAFLKAWRGLAGFDGSSSFFTWLYRIVLNTSLSARRRQSTRDVSLEAFAELGNLRGAGTSEDVSTVVETTERRRMVQRAIESLDEEYKTVIILRDIQQLGYEEIGRVLDLPPGTIKSRIYRARLELKERLKPLVRE